MITSHETVFRPSAEKQSRQNARRNAAVSQESKWCSCHCTDFGIPTLTDTEKSNDKVKTKAWQEVEEKKETKRHREK